ncbi:MAG: hypothetical protein IKY59_06760 [Oscillospiraceae bacterium]|nr:hypothetical protein [Oscillospiraceae bacterium]
MKKELGTYALINEEKKALQRSIRRMTQNANVKELRIIHNFMQGILR